ncbi:peroxisomal acyl-coenzyme A thioester hydrolase 1 [Diutina catenulata]
MSLYPEGPINIDDVLGVTQTGENTFRGKKPLNKPIPIAKGAYGGNICAQALVCAMATVPEGMRPHSFHSFFVKAVSDQEPVDWEVQHISDGRNFCNRSVKGRQGGVIKYIATMSLTKRNSIAREQAKFDAWAAERRAEGKPVQVSSEDDDEFDEMPVRPFSLETPLFDKWFPHGPQGIEIDADFGRDYLTYHKLPSQLWDLSLTKYEEKQDVVDRKMAWMAKLGCTEDGHNQPITGMNPTYQFAGLAVLSDSAFLGFLTRSMRLDLEGFFNYGSVSLDHIMYFHDDDFDVTQWMTFTHRPVRVANSRALVEAEIYNSKGAHVATIIQEGLLDFSSVQKRAKL